MNFIQQSLTEYATKVHLLQPHPYIAEQVKNSISQQQPAPFSKLRLAYFQLAIEGVCLHAGFNHDLVADVHKPIFNLPISYPMAICL